MGIEDAREFGPIVDNLIGRECERTLATNTIKLRFGTELDPRGHSYIWIDPPWVLKASNFLVTSSDDYSEENFSAWSRCLDPLNRVVLSGWSVGAAETTFTFANGYEIIIPDGDGIREDGYWYAHWYARHTERKRKETV